MTYEDRKDQIPDVQDILDQYDAERRYIKRTPKSNLGMVNQLNDVVVTFKPAHVFFRHILQLYVLRSWEKWWNDVTRS